MEPVSLTLASVGALALTEGVKFVYTEASDLIKHWLDSKKAGADPAPVPIEVTLPAAFGGQLQDPKANLAVIAANEDRFESLTGMLALYASGTKPINPADERLLQNLDALRGLLEATLGQRLTLQGEPRPATGTSVVLGTVDIAGSMKSGAAAGVKIDTLAANTEGHAKLGGDLEGGTIFGVWVDTKGKNE
jgi:hypothetical protein